MSASFSAMKLASLFALLLLPVAAFGKDTAYQALRAIGAERDHSLLNRVVEVKGRNCTPQPEKWTVVLDDPLARGGVREIEVANGHIISERTPVKTYSGTSEGMVMNFQKLNLDSEGAFTLAVEEAKNARIGFDAVDYVLRCEDANATPTWVLQLLDDQKHSLGSITVAADSGAILSKTFGGAAFGDTSASRSNEERSAEDEQAHKNNLGHRIDRSLHRAGADLEEFFTGRRTMDRRFRGE